MKKAITLLSIVSLSFMANAQESPGLLIIPSTISFELGEGYTLGDIHNQNDWKVSDNPYLGEPDSFVVTDELSNNGDNSLRIAYDENFNANFNIGAHYHLHDISEKNFEVYFRINPDHYSSYAINLIDSSKESLGNLIAFRRGVVAIRDWERWGESRLDFVVSPDTWYKLNVEFDKVNRTINYKLDDNSVYTRRDVSDLGFDYNRIDFLQNNMDENSKMYIDDLRFYENTNLSTLEINKKIKISVYPNPTSDFITIQNVEGMYKILL